MNYILFDTNTNLHNHKYSFQKNITQWFKYDFSSHLYPWFRKIFVLYCKVLLCCDLFKNCRT